MTVGIIGLGLIGGSLAKAFCREEGNTVLGWDTDSTIVEFAQIAQAIHGPLTDERLGELDLLLLATYPEAVVEHMTRLAPLLSKHTMVIDCAGTKEKVCAGVFPLAERYGFRFLGGHPMAGTHFSGFKYSRADLFDGAPMVIVPPRFDDIRLLDEAKKLLAPVGFGRVSITTAQEHDKRIAFTSQMAHVISNAYIKSPTARNHDGFSAGSYKDLTRVAWLNPAMWAELFLENRENLLFELDTLIRSLEQYREAIQEDDFAALCQLLEEEVLLLPAGPLRRAGDRPPPLLRHRRRSGHHPGPGPGRRLRRQGGPGHRRTPGTGLTGRYVSSAFGGAYTIVYPSPGRERSPPHFQYPQGFCTFSTGSSTSIRRPVETPLYAIE